ncbi:MAG: SRPBCC family protein [Steroidobacteraceae bacterium]
MRRFSASPERVFDAWFDPEKLRVWMFKPPWGGMLRMRIDARVGGSFSFVERRNGEDFQFAGEYLEITRPHRLAFTWITPRGSPNGARVAIDVRSLAFGCEVSLTHDANHAETTAWHGMFHSLSELLGESGK